MESPMSIKGIFSRNKSKPENRPEAEDSWARAPRAADGSAQAQGDAMPAGGPAEAVTRRNLLDAEEGMTFIVRDIDTADEEMNAFLFRLGCYSGEPVTVISKKKKNCIVAIKDSRYTLDKSLCEAIII